MRSSRPAPSAQRPESAPRGAHVVLMPGMLCTRRLWVGQRDAILAAGVDVLDWQPRGATITALAASAVAGTVGGASPVVLVGHSLGAIAAMAAAAARPDAVAGLVLVSTTARAPRPEQRILWDGMARDVTAGTLTPAQVAARLAPGQLSGTSSDPDLPAVLAEMGAATSPRRLVADLEAQATRTDLRPALRRITVPALVVAGADDRVCPPALHEEIADALPRSELEVVPGAGHMCPVEAPGGLSELIEGFLSNLVRDAAPRVLGSPRRAGSDLSAGRARR